MFLITNFYLFIPFFSFQLWQQWAIIEVVVEGLKRKARLNNFFRCPNQIIRVEPRLKKVLN